MDGVATGNATLNGDKNAFDETTRT